MAAVAAIVGAVTAVVGTGYSAVKANQVSQQEKGTLGAANKAIPTPPDVNLQQAAAGEAGSTAAAQAQQTAGKKAGGYAGTILTGPDSTLTSTTGPQRKTLLGL
jgi:hypothetical protein